MSLLHFIKITNSNLDKIKPCMTEKDYEKFISYVKKIMSLNGGEYFYFSPEFPALSNSHVTPFVPFSEWYLNLKFGIVPPDPCCQWIEIAV